MEWLYGLERGDTAGGAATPALAGLISRLSRSPNDPRKKILTVLANARGFSDRAIAEHLDVSRNSVRVHLSAFAAGGVECLFGRKPKTRTADDESFKKALFSLLHEPPALSGHNRTTWRMKDLKKTMIDRGHPAGDAVIREAIRKAGFRWRSAKVVLTSNDPDYREKLDHVQAVLSGLGKDERFFSIDEFGPFAIKAKPGRVLAEPGVMPSVPQWQKSKGWLIATAALELSGNRVTHFYSRTKNTAEMIQMAKILLEEYRDAEKLYLSWDAASWHMSRELLAFVDQHNGKLEVVPKLELVPLPASAQFLNVIESVFSGMARAIIHNSDYPSVQAAMEAIDRYFDERNRHYLDNPKRAGKKIWGLERTEANFDASNNCKDPAYR
ncbi:MAG: IS630 family transposase [Thiobacillaceae bacterium]